MIVKVHEHKVEIIKTPVNEKEVNVTKCTFQFDEIIPNNYVKKAFFTLNGNAYEQIIVNNECDIPNEVLLKKGSIELGVVAYKVENEELIQRFNPSPAYFDSWSGSLREAQNTEPITPTDKEQIEQMLSNINIDGDKSGKITTITITYKDGTTKELQLEDGKSIEYNWQGTQLGIRQEGQSEYVYVDLKGEPGVPGAVKFIVVNELPTEDIQTDTIYLVPSDDPTTQDLYLEYMYINNQWELLGQKQIVVDLTDYYTKTETNTLLNGKANTSDIPTKTSQLTNNSGFITNAVNNLANYYTKTEIDNTIGDINTALDTINGESVGD